MDTFLFGTIKFLNKPSLEGVEKESNPILPNDGPECGSHAAALNRHITRSKGKSPDVDLCY